jgi:hypothetical protein
MPRLCRSPEQIFRCLQRLVGLSPIGSPTKEFPEIGDDGSALEVSRTIERTVIRRKSDVRSGLGTAHFAKRSVRSRTSSEVVRRDNSSRRSRLGSQRYAAYLGPESIRNRITPEQFLSAREWLAISRSEKVRVLKVLAGLEAKLLNFSLGYRHHIPLEGARKWLRRLYKFCHSHRTGWSITQCAV